MRSVFAVLSLFYGLSCGGTADFSSSKSTNKPTKKPTQEESQPNPGLDVQVYEEPPQEVDEDTPEETPPDGVVEPPVIVDPPPPIVDPPPPPELRWIEKSFKGGAIDSTNIKLSSDLNQLEYSVKMAREIVQHTQNFEQKERPLALTTFNQGSLGERVPEAFSQEELGILDIILVVDNSGSMGEEQENLSQRLEPLMSYVADSDWRIGLVTTDPRNGCLVAVFKHDDQDVEEKFREKVSGLGTNGSGNERGIGQAVASLNCDTPWIRNNSNIAVLIVSDSDNCSNGNDCRNQDQASHEFLLNALVSEPHNRVLGETAKVYGLIHVPETECDTSENVGNIYHQAILETEGVSGAICDDDYTATLERISLDLLNSLKLQFVLKHQPRPGTADLMVNGVKITEGFKIEGDTLIFNEAPPQGAQIELLYLVGENTIVDRFQLEAGIDQDELLVLVDGQEVPGEAYTLEKDGLLIFQEAPPELSGIEARYKLETGLDLEFDLGVPLLGSPVVWIGDDLAAQDSYEVTENKLVFKAPPADGVKLKVSYSHFGDPILSYPIGVNLDLLEGIESKFVGEADEVPDFEIQDGQVLVLAEQFKENRELQINFRFYQASQMEISLDDSYREGSLEVIELPEQCTLDDIQVVDRSVVIECPMGETPLDLKMDVVSSYTTSFEIPGVKQPDQALWLVKVDGKEFHEFTRDGHVIRLNDTVDPNSEITIRAEWTE